MEPYDPTTPLLILKTFRGPMHHGTLGAIRSLGRAGVPVYASREPAPRPVVRSRYLCRDSIGILSTSDPEANVSALKALQRRVGRPMVILVVDDAGAVFVAENAETLRPQFQLPEQKPDMLRMVSSKANIPQLCARLGVPTPETCIVRTTDALSAAGRGIRYPAVVKIAEPRLLPEGLRIRRALLARQEEDVAEYRSQLRAAPSADIVVQEYIPEDLAEDWFYHGYHRAGGEPVVGFTGRKIRSYPPFLGATSYAVSIVNEDVVATARQILRHLEYAGIVELEFRFDKRDRKYKFIDFNPRLGAQFQFLRNARDVDVVRAMHLDLTGRRVPHGHQVEGCTFVSDFDDVPAFLAYSRIKAITAPQWLGQILGAEEHNWFDVDDLWPFAAACGESVKRLASKAVRARSGATGPARRHGRPPPPPAPAD